MTNHSENGQALHYPLTESGVDSQAVHGLIVSLTSYPRRMEKLPVCLCSLLQQSLKPQKLILWLAEEEFPGKEKSVPQDILALKDFGLEIDWTHNTKSYKKLLPALEKYPSHPIVTADDDFVYPPEWLERLYQSYAAHQFARQIYAHRAHKIALSGQHILPYKMWKKLLPPGEPSFLHFPTSGGGILYPPNSLHPDVMNENLFLKLAPTADDIFFWAMATRNGSKTRVIENQIKLGKDFYKEQIENTLYQINGIEGQNDVQFAAMLRYFPELAEKLLEAGKENFNSMEYWEQRYFQGGNSGAGSYNRLKDFKAEIINNFVKKNNIHSVVEFGVGDGSQLSSFEFQSYIGIDVSHTVIDMLHTKFPLDSSKKFFTLDTYAGQQAEVAMSLDVIYHLIEDTIYHEYMERLFNAAQKYVIIYSSNQEGADERIKHVRHRKFTKWIAENRKDWTCIEFIKNKYPLSEKNNDQKNFSFADFYIYQKS